MNDYITIKEFSNICGMKVSTIRRKRKNIPLITEEGLVLKGTRYPFSLRGYKLNNVLKKRYVVFKAIFEEKYISHKEARMYFEDFKSFLGELFELGYIRRTKFNNIYGANGYECTIKGAKKFREIDMLKNQEKYHMFNDIASIAGNFFGKATSEIYKGVR